jgi:hypothetical protein
MRSLGNTKANSIWEAALHLRCNFRKPDPDSSQEQKERFIIAKYKFKEFLEPMPTGLSVVSSLIDGILK